MIYNIYALIVLTAKTSLWYGENSSSTLDRGSVISGIAPGERPAFQAGVFSDMRGSSPLCRSISVHGVVGNIRACQVLVAGSNPAGRSGRM